MHREEALEKIKTAKKLYIYGAGDVAKQVSFCLRGAPYYFKINAFVVSDLERIKEQNIGDIPIISCDELNVSSDLVVIIAVLEKYKDEICLKLEEMGISDYIVMTFESDLWCEIRRGYYEIYTKNTEDVPFFMLNEELNVYENSNNKYKKSDFKIYIAKSHLDKSLKEQVINKEWEKEIQVGAELTNKRIAEIKDNVGNNISQKNEKYCELTALYWIWKNTDSEYAGLSHYRRKFVISQEEIEKIINSNIDVVVTIPIINLPNVVTMYKKNHLAEDWEVMVRGIQTLYPQYISALHEIEQSNFYIAYNMFIMKRKCLNEYCEWLFPLLEYCENNCGTKEDKYQNRYIGFLAERLVNVFLLYHKKDYKVVYANKHFYE